MASTQQGHGNAQRTQAQTEREVARGQAYAAAMMSSIWGILPPTTRDISTDW
jgi:hypothetical protein